MFNHVFVAQPIMNYVCVNNKVTLYICLTLCLNVQNDGACNKTKKG